MAVVMVIVSGCQLLGIGGSPRRPPGEKHASNPGPIFQTSPDTLGVEIVTFRVPESQYQRLIDLWQSADEQSFTPLLRRELAKNGLRCGVLPSANVPVLINLAPPKSGQNSAMSPTPPSATGHETASPRFAESTNLERVFVLSDVETEPIAQTQFVTLLPGKHCELLPRTDTVEELHLFWTDPATGSPCGKTYRKVDGRVVLNAAPMPDGSALIDIVPTIEYGEPEPHIWPRNGEWQRDMVRPKLIFDTVRITQTLYPGQVIVLGPSDHTAAGFGKYFFTQQRGSTERKILAIRFTGRGK